jgi:hypothetical protein
MDIGSGIAAASGILGAVAVTYKVVDAIWPKGGNSNGIVVVKHCSEHSGVMESLSNIKESAGKHEKWLESISKDIKLLLMRKQT